MDEYGLQEFYGEYGRVINAKVLKHPDGKSKGSAFVSFATHDAAKSALETNGQDYQGRPLKVNFAG